MMIDHDCGCARTVLVTDRGDGPIGITTSILARAVEAGKGPRVRFQGDVTFEQRVRRHICRVILPLLDAITAGLGLSMSRFEVSGTNIGAASQRDVGMTVSGFSADLAVFLAMLSARLQIPVDESFIATGCIASRKGDIRMVRNVPAKLDAALADPDISTFAYPSPNGDISLSRLAPEEKDSVRSAVVRTMGEIKLLPVADVRGLVANAFTQEDICRGAMRSGYFGCTACASVAESPIGKVVAHLGCDNRRTFEVCVRQRLLAGDQPAATTLIAEFAQYHLGCKRYPSRFGTFLRKVILSIPPATRMTKLTRPLIPTATVIELSQMADESDYRDVRDLHKASEPPALQNQSLPLDESETSDTHQARPESGVLDWVLREIGEENLARRIGIKIDAARATYVMERNTIDSAAEFYGAITAFYVHLLSSSGEVDGLVDVDSAGAHALGLLESGYARWGGKKAAQAEATTGVHGGLRHIFDLMTEQHKRQRKEEYIQYVLKTTVDDLSHEEKREFMAAFIERCAAILPPEILAAPVARFVNGTEELVRAYVTSLDRVQQMMRGM